MKTKSWQPKGSMASHTSDWPITTSRDKSSRGLIRVMEELVSYITDNKKIETVYCFASFNK